jgi:glycerophosphoryl diester phosphodiesterase
LIVLKKENVAINGQIIIDEDSGNIYIRAYSDGAWRDWKSKFDAVLGVIDTEKLRPKNLDTHSHTIAHRGVPNSTPAATKPSYVKAKEMGLLIAEGDVRFTSDNVPILFHDATYTVNGVTHTIANETYEQFMEYDIGAAFSPAFAGTYGLTLSEFLDLCNDLQLYPTLDFKVGTTQQVNDCLAIIDSKRVKIFNYKASVANLKTIIDHDPYASVRLGADDYSDTLKNNLIALLGYGNQTHQVHCVFAYGYGSWTSEQIAACRATGAIMGVSSINNNTQLQALTEDVDIIFTEHGFNATMQQTINAMAD